VTAVTIVAAGAVQARPSSSTTGTLALRSACTSAGAGALLTQPSV
jgi:hypothetical protein